MEPSFFAFIIVLAVYFLPFIIAKSKGKRNLNAIFFLNLVAGWTGIGWLGAMLWALIDDAPAPMKDIS